MKADLSDVTLVAVDCTPKVHLAQRAIDKCMEQCDFGAVKLLCRNAALRHAAICPPIRSLEDYSKFMVRGLWKYVETSHALVVQSDGYILNGEAWNPEFLEYDYIGAPWLPSNAVGNGGFSLRSRKLLELLARHPLGGTPHPEDSHICIRHRKTLEDLGIKFAPLELARRFAFEGRSWSNGQEWQGVPTRWQGQFGFHSWLTPLPKDLDRPKVFHHTGELGDVIYSLPTIAALGGGVLYLSADNRFPYPRPTREMPSPNRVNSLASLIEAQDYIWRVQFTHGLPYSTDYDLNRFRLPWKNRTAADYDSIFSLHLKAFGADWPEDKPWLTVKDPIVVEGRPIVVSRSERYHNHDFPWYDFVQCYGDQMVFVGSDLEAHTFQGFGLPKFKIPHRKTENLLELARVIAGGKMFVGNQSCPLAIALGLGQNVIVETWELNPNCMLNRENAIHWRRGGVVIPLEWL